ncbi:Glycine cleavage system transcriptional activator [Roseovarius albus]|uniref:Glycine cleavage system transcriptional activator n=1 Tax=Roseovarius albus TaxID=1247867 RepID=A0A1X6ZRS4_9RHOB|nr:LysR substrate-binding domain-containing protein [Roseovarius albus]SLN59414.1 Glycine cleavage system transcriptional activator [Roseovarius albus]
MASQTTVTSSKPIEAANPAKALPAMDYLLAFEAAAKTQDFAQASEALNLSETTIRRKVRYLEKYYDMPLFIRRQRSISLTQKGTVLLAAAEQSLDLLRDVSRDMPTQYLANPVSLAAPNSVASLWLTPQLCKFNNTIGRIRVSVTASDYTADCMSEAMDLIIARGDGHWPGYEAQFLFGETVFPVCSPDYLRCHPEAADPAALLQLDLIDVENPRSGSMTWDTWLRSTGHPTFPMDNVMIVNTCPLSVQAAVEGLGVALGSAHLVDALLDSGALVRPTGDTSMRTGAAYYLLSNPRRDSFPEKRIIKEWLLRLSAGRKRYDGPDATLRPSAQRRKNNCQIGDAKQATTGSAQEM